MLSRITFMEEMKHVLLIKRMFIHLTVRETQRAEGVIRAGYLLWRR